MTAVYSAALALLSVAGLLTLVRLIRGPSIPDRILALDVMSVLLVSGIAVHSASRPAAEFASVLIVVALLGFVGSVTAARLAGRRRDP